MSYPFDYLRNRIWPTDSRKAFVIYPFGGEGAAFCERVVKKAITESGLTFHDAKAKNGAQPILEDILNGIGEAELVIAVLIGRNPNVMWELGIAHTWKPPTQVLSIEGEPDEKDRLPFNVQGYRHLFVKREDDQADIRALKDRITEVRKEHDALVEESVITARNSLGPNEFRFMNQWGKHRNFIMPAYHAIGASSELTQPSPTVSALKIFGSEKRHVGPRLLATHFDGASAGILCRMGILACNTARKNGGLEFSYWWTPLGLRLLELLGVIGDRTAMFFIRQLPPRIRSDRGHFILGG